MRESVALARRLGVRLHSHVAETADEEAFCLERFGCRPVELFDRLGFLGDDVWLAHAVHLSVEDIRRIAASGTAIAHCPTSNLRLGSGVAPVRDLVDAGVPVGAGRGRFRVQRRRAHAGRGAPGRCSSRAAAAVPARWAYGRRSGWAPVEAPTCLGRDDVGSLEAGKRADIALFDVSGLANAGADADPVGRDGPGLAAARAPPRGGGSLRGPRRRPGDRRRARACRGRPPGGPPDPGAGRPGSVSAPCQPRSGAGAPQPAEWHWEPAGGRCTVWRIIDVRRLTSRAPGTRDSTGS